MEEKRQKAIAEIAEDHKERMRLKWRDEKMWENVLERVRQDRMEAVYNGELNFEKTIEEEAKEFYYE